MNSPIMHYSMWSPSEKSKVGARQRWKLYLCCVVGISIPSSDAGEWKQRHKEDFFLLQCLCLNCSRPISSARLPVGLMTNGSTIFELRRTGKTCALSQWQHWTASKDINFSSVPCQCYLFAVSLYFSIWKPAGWHVSKRHGFIPCII